MSKQLTVCYFAGFREHAGTDRESVSMDVATAADLFTRLQHRHGSSEPLGHCKVAINDEFGDWQTTLKDGDSVVFIPPVAGG